VNKKKAHQLFVAPPNFQPNTIFVGRKAELEVLHTHLYHSRAQGQDPKSVLITGVPGSGKTHLAREYVFTHRDSYPGGIFWIRAGSFQGTCEGFIEIARAAGLLDHIEFNPIDHPADLPDALDALDWLARRKHWLLVLDGVEVKDGDFRCLIPKNPEGSVLYTTTDADVFGLLIFQSYHLSIPPLQVEDGCKLMYGILGIDTPTATQAFIATIMVKSYDCLPLAIHAMGHHLKALGKSIGDVDWSESNRIETGVFREVINEMYRTEKRQALNLLHLLSFLDNKIPVRLIEFGSDSMSVTDSADIMTRPRAGEPPDLNTTIETLIQHGLIKRMDGTKVQASRPLTENSVSQSVGLSHQQDELGNDNQEGLISLEQEIPEFGQLKIHTELQRFFRDEVRLKDVNRSWELEQKETIGMDQAGFYDTWLILTSRFIIESYETAQRTAAKLHGRGLCQSDCQEYANHISRLAQLFAERKERSSGSLPWYAREAQENLQNLHSKIRLELQTLSPDPYLVPRARQQSIFKTLPTRTSGVPISRDDLNAVDFVLTESYVVEQEFDATIGSGSQYVSDRVFSAGPHSTLDTQTALTGPTAPTAATSSELETEDLRTVYSDTLTMDGSIKEAYVNELAHELVKAVSTFKLDSASMKRVAEAIPGSLKAFSSRLGCTSSSQQVQRDVTVFIHKYRQ
jgi:hypothetical protein